jgi:hypothetical protein
VVAEEWEMKKYRFEISKLDSNFVLHGEGVGWSFDDAALRLAKQFLDGTDFVLIRRTRWGTVQYGFSDAILELETLEHYQGETSSRWNVNRPRFRMTKADKARLAREEREMREILKGIK